MTHRCVIAIVMMIGCAAAAPAQSQDDRLVTSMQRASAAPAEPSIPDAILLPDDLRPLVIGMIEKSATFRTQCQQIGEAHDVLVRVVVKQLGEHSYRARTTFQRLRGGFLHAQVEIGAEADPTEMVSHELEHVIEQLEGIKLHDLARRHEDVWLASKDVFETARAVRVGRVVLEEIRTANRVARHMTRPEDRVARGDH